MSNCLYNLPHWVFTTTAQEAVSLPVRGREAGAETERCHLPSAGAKIQATTPYTAGGRAGEEGTLHLFQPFFTGGGGRMSRPASQLKTLYLVTAA